MALSWPLAFGLTLAIESPVYVLGTRSSLKGPAALGCAIVVNLITHPLAFWWVALGASWVRFAAAELTVTAVEALLLWLMSRSLHPRRPLALVDAATTALSANALSAGIGLLLSSH